ncbi:hypothetical protein ABK040_001837 [Willaertia magna]
MQRIHKIGFSSSLLRLETTLLCGQTFTWKYFSPNTYVGVLNNYHSSLNSILNNDLLKNPIVVELKETSDDIEYKQLFPINNDDNNTAVDPNHLNLLLHDFFHLQTMDLVELNNTFATSDPSFYGKIYQYYPGWRVVRMNPLECLISFICSSNNNVQRITKMIQSLCENYGTLLGNFMINGIETPIYAFPTLDQLTSCTEKELKNLGFGYRARYIVDTVKSLKKKEDNFLWDLRDKEKYPTSFSVLEELIKFKGVGMKVASCIALYSCDRFDVVPVDTHILKLVRNQYDIMKDIKEKKTFTKNEVKTIMSKFKELFGEYVGLAQMILYGSQLSNFKNRIPEEVRNSILKSKINDENSEEENNTSEEEKEVKKSRRVVKRKRNLD